jgi:hypothetical protein
MVIRPFNSKLVFLLVCTSLPSFGGLVLNLPNSTQSAAPGEVVTFYGSLSNAGDGAIFLNGLSAQINAVPADLTVDPDIFFSEAPLFLAAGESSGQIPLLAVTIQPGFTGAYGPFLGSLFVLGGADGDAINIVAAGEYSVVVTPEPGSGVLISIFAAYAWGRKKSLLRRRAGRATSVSL